MNKEQLKNELIESKVNTFEYVVASLRMNKPIKYLIKKLDTLNYVINYRLNRYSLKKNSKFPRVEFYCFNQYARNNTHSHMLLRIPKEYDRNYVLELMSKSFKRLGDRFILFNEKANNEIANVIYSLKSHHSKYVPEQLIVI